MSDPGQDIRRLKAWLIGRLPIHTEAGAGEIVIVDAARHGRGELEAAAQLLEVQLLKARMVLVATAAKRTSTAIIR